MQTASVTESQTGNLRPEIEAPIWNRIGWSSGVGSWLYLAGAAVFWLAADGRNTAALAMWAAQALSLRFVRTQPMARGLLALFLVRIAVVPVAFRGVIPIPVPYYYIFLLIAGLSGMIPYALDRWIAPRFTGIANSLVFPVALVVSQWIYGKGPMGSWGSIAYSQTGNLALEQLLSVTGLTGITFLIGWFAGSVNWAWEGRNVRRLAGWGAAMSAVLLGGELRLALAPPTPATVRVASLSWRQVLPESATDPVAQVRGGHPSAQDVEAFRAATKAGNDDLLVRAEREAQAGAKIVFWAEGSAQVLKQDESALIAQGQQLAKGRGIYLVMALNTWTVGAPKPLENKAVTIGPDGRVAMTYWKVRPTPGPEMDASIATDGRLQTLDTVFGRIATPICYDTDFPTYLAQAGRARVDLAVSPAHDWRAIDPRHTEIASFRAIEQGFNLVRQASDGRAMAFDYQGHVLAVADAYDGSDQTMVARVPVRGVRTVYSVLGDWLVWCSMAGLAAFVGMGVRRKMQLRLRQG